MENETNTTLEELDELERSKHLPLTVFLVVIMVVGIVGNILVLIIYKRKFKRSSARSYILSLAIADLSVCVVGIPYHVLDLTLILTYTHTNLCKVLSFFIGACTLSSVFILLVVGLDRYFKVCRPLKRQIRDFGDKKACLLASIVAVVISIPNGIIYGQSAVQTSVNNLTGVECFIADEYHGSDLAVGYLGLNLFVFVMSVLFLIIIYGFICRKIYKQDKMSGEIMLKKTKKICFCCTVENQEDEEADGEVIGAMNNEAAEDNRVTDDVTDSEFQTVDMETEGTENEHLNSKLKSVKDSTGKPDRQATAPRPSCAMIRHKRPGSKAGEKNTMKITLMMMTITIVFVISYLPFIVISIIDSMVETLWFDITVTESLLLDLMLRFYLINNVANPVIYSFWDKRFRKEIKRLVRNVACCYRKEEVNGKSQIYTKSMSGLSSSYTKNTETVLDK